MSLQKKRYWLDTLSKIDEEELPNDKIDVVRLIVIHSMFGYADVYKLIDLDDIKIISVMRYDKEFTKDYEELGVLKSIESKEVSEVEYNNLKKEIDNLRIWELPVTNDYSGFDGSTYVLELNRLKENKKVKRNYHLVSRWSPQDSTRFRIICEKLMGLIE